MSSIYQKVLGSDFSKLHPNIQKRFGFSSSDGIAAIGRGTMDKVYGAVVHIAVSIHWDMAQHPVSAKR